MDVREAVSSRYSCRAFLPDPVPEKTVRDIIRIASGAPSAGNMQPWFVYAVTGSRLQQLKLCDGVPIDVEYGQPKSLAAEVRGHRPPHPAKADKAHIVHCAPPAGPSVAGTRSNPWSMIEWNEARFNPPGQAAGDTRHQHRNASAILLVARTQLGNQVAFLEPDADENVSRGHCGEEQMPGGHVRRRPEGDEETQHERVTYEPDGKSYRMTIAMQNADAQVPLYVMLNPVGVYVQVGMSWQQVPSGPAGGATWGVVKVTDTYTYDVLFTPEVTGWAELIPGYMHVRVQDDMLVSPSAQPKDDVVERRTPIYVYLRPPGGPPPVFIPMPPH